MLYQEVASNFAYFLKTSFPKFPIFFFFFTFVFKFNNIDKAFEIIHKTGSIAINPCSALTTHTGLLNFPPVAVAA